MSLSLTEFANCSWMNFVVVEQTPSFGYFRSRSPHRKCTHCSCPNWRNKVGLEAAQFRRWRLTWCLDCGAFGNHGWKFRIPVNQDSKSRWGMGYVIIVEKLPMKLEQLCACVPFTPWSFKVRCSRLGTVQIQLIFLLIGKNAVIGNVA